MQEVRGLFFPDADTHMASHVLAGPSFAGKGTYQWHKLAAAMKNIHDFRHALDIGAHVGTWSWPLSRMFSRLSAFEPLEMHREHFRKNVPFNDPHCAVSLFDCGLGDKVDVVRLSIAPNVSGGAFIREAGLPESDEGYDIGRIVPLDTFGLEQVDFVKIDVEGFELAVLKGGEQTMRRWKPTIIVEQKPGNAKRHGFGDTAAVELLASWGADVKWEMGGDYCLRWKHR